jgi:hypothetical protein
MSESGSVVKNATQLIAYRVFRIKKFPAVKRSNLLQRHYIELPLSKITCKGGEGVFFRADSIARFQNKKKIFLSTVKRCTRRL